MSFIINSYSFGFNPLSLSPALWLSDMGSDQAVWTDISGNGRNVTQATTALQPAIVPAAQNGRQIRRFDSDSLNMSDSAGLRNQNFSIFIAINPLAPPVAIATLLDLNHVTFQGFVVQSEDALTNRYYYLTYYDGSTFQPAGGFGIGRGIRLTNGVGQILSYIKNGTEVRGYKDGVVAWSPNAAGSATVSYGSSNPFRIGGAVGTAETRFIKADVGEILIFPTALNATNRQNVEAYLRTKWGTP